MPLPFLDKSCLVVAHPDDEILWFSSIISQVDLVLVCFLGNPSNPERGPARKRVFDQYPLTNIECLNLDVPMGRSWCRGNNLIETAFGVELPAEVQSPYEKSYARLYSILSQRLVGYKNVFTHNPWGEYGHEMHIQLHRVINEISNEANFHVWFSNYVSDKTASLARQYTYCAPVKPITLNTDIALSDAVRALYVAEECWTVSKHHNWKENETFNRICKPNDCLSEGREIFPFNHLVW